MNERAVSDGVRFLVLMIPTKEMVFGEIVESPSESYRILLNYEHQLWTHTRAFLEEHRIDYIDALPALRNLLSGGIQPYPVSHDGHPNRLGHRAIAELIHQYIEQ